MWIQAFQPSEAVAFAYLAGREAGLKLQLPAKMRRGAEARQAADFFHRFVRGHQIFDSPLTFQLQPKLVGAAADFLPKKLMQIGRADVTGPGDFRNGSFRMGGNIVLCLLHDFVSSGKRAAFLQRRQKARQDPIKSAQGLAAGGCALSGNLRDFFF